MEISKWTKKETVDGMKGMMVRVNFEEALALIKSLSSQILSRDPNSDRVESTTDEGEYFSISVNSKD